MEYLVNSDEMKCADFYTIHQVGIPSLVLMERAALAVVETLLSGDFNLQHIAVICGHGNNGGDGIAIARLLKAQHYKVTLYFVGDLKRCSPETQQQIHIAQYYRINIETCPKSLSHITTIIDALFGIGLSRPITGDYAQCIEKINHSGADILAVDMPSGISADNGKIMSVAVKAKKTVTFAFKKIGQVLYPGCEYCGKVIVKDIGIDINYIDTHCMTRQIPAVFSYNLLQDITEFMPKRANYSNKGTFGKVLVIAGSENMSGAAYFSAKAAYSTGAGLVKIYTHQSNSTILLTQLPEAILTTYTSDHIDFSILDVALNWATVIVIGPGIGMTPAATKILMHVISTAQVPLIIDADGLNLLAENKTLISTLSIPTIFTPHMGEMMCLTQTTVKHIADNLLTVATQFSSQYQVTCVLKDARTVVASPNYPLYINQSGNNGMATGGSGDILTGIIAGLIGQSLRVEHAAVLGVYLHGLAGDKAQQKNNQYSLTALDILDGIVNVLNEI